MDTGIVNVLQFAIDGVAAQQNATANNLANSQTPNFAASEVSFQQSLQAALGGTGAQSAQITSTPSATAMASDGNNVDIGHELIDAEDETLQYSALSESINGQFRLISGASGGSFQ